MKKKVIFSATTLLICLTILTGAFVMLPKLTHAAAPQSHTATKASTTTATISVSQANLPDSQCIPITQNSINDVGYQSCLVTVTLNQSVPKGLSWKSSYSSKSCYYTCSSMNWYFSVFHGSGTLFNKGDTAQVLIICPVFSANWYHGGLTATFVFSGPANTVKVNYGIGGGD